MKITKFNYGILSSLFALMSLSSVAQKPGNYTITGDVKDAQKVYFYAEGSRFGNLTDSVIPIKGHFEFNGITKSVDFATIEIVSGEKFPSYVDFLLEAGNIKIKGNNAKFALPSGTVDNNLIEKFESEREMSDSNHTIYPYYDQVNTINEHLYHLRKAENPDETKIKAYMDSANILEKRIDGYMEWRTDKEIKAMQANPKTYFTASYLLRVYSSIDSNLASKIFNDLGPEIQASTLGLKLQKELGGNKLLNDGIVAPAFTTTDINGSKLSLSDFKGKYVLLDFWATWCGPCRAANPELIKIYNKYHDKGFEIIGIADDDKNVDGWKKAVKLDKTGIWHHVLRGAIPQANNTSVDLSNLYKVSAYPTQYLIDKDGKIISTYDVGNLENKLAELMP